MATTTTSAPSHCLTAILLVLTLAILGAAQPPPPPPDCTEELVSFSPCLAYVSSPPNNLSNSAPPKCCDTIWSSLESGGAVCFCYLLWDPPLLVFPVNHTRILSLPSACPLRSISRNIASAHSLESLCSGSSELPPLRSSTIPRISSPPPSGVGNASSPLMSPVPGSTSNSSFLPGKEWPPPPVQTPPSSAVEPARVSTAAMKQISKSNTWFLPAILVFLVPISSHL